MSHYKQALDYIKSVIDLDTSVNTATKGLHFDINKKNDYPLFHVLVIDSNIAGATVQFTFRVIAAALRIVNNSAQGPDRWEINDNEDENLDQMHDVLLRFHLRITKQGGDFNIVSNTPIIPLIEERTNVVDGWQYDFVIEQPIDEAIC